MKHPRWCRPGIWCDADENTGAGAHRSEPIQIELTDAAGVPPIVWAYLEQRPSLGTHLRFTDRTGGGALDSLAIPVSILPRLASAARGMLQLAAEQFEAAAERDEEDARPVPPYVAGHRYSQPFRKNHAGGRFDSPRPRARAVSGA